MVHFRNSSVCRLCAHTGDCTSRPKRAQMPSTTYFDPSFILQKWKKLLYFEIRENRPFFTKFYASLNPSLKLGVLGENGPFSKFSLISKCNNFFGFRSYKLGSKYVLDDILALLGREVRAPVCAPKRHTKRLKMTKKRFFSRFRRRPVCLVCAHTGVVRFTPNTSLHV